jgi:hypothetical protein
MHIRPGAAAPLKAGAAPRCAGPASVGRWRRRHPAAAIQNRAARPPIAAAAAATRPQEVVCSSRDIDRATDPLAPVKMRVNSSSISGIERHPVDPPKPNQVIRRSLTTGRFSTSWSGARPTNWCPTSIRMWQAARGVSSGQDASQKRFVEDMMSTKMEPIPLLPNIDRCDPARAGRIAGRQRQT